MSQANVCYAFLDARVIAGQADHEVVEGRTTARLLEEVAALAGVLRHLGVSQGEPVALRELEGIEAITECLAVARLGAVISADAQLRLADLDVDWPLLMRAGRTDPAAVVLVAEDAPYASGVTVRDQIVRLLDIDLPAEVDTLRGMLIG